MLMTEFKQALLGIDHSADLDGEHIYLIGKKDCVVRRTCPNFKQYKIGPPATSANAHMVMTWLSNL